jgi:hypothetical protein
MHNGYNAYSNMPLFPDTPGAVREPGMASEAIRSENFRGH